ncbi:MAG: hypothetical protein LUE29_02670 [Lachnospiraceae bacterium]|nr:hypothetical protein [Lachnospiraceae bacterium]
MSKVDEATGTYIDLRETESGLSYLYDNALVLRVVGIIRPVPLRYFDRDQRTSDARRGDYPVAQCGKERSGGGPADGIEKCRNADLTTDNLKKRHN